MIYHKNKIDEKICYTLIKGGSEMKKDLLIGWIYVIVFGILISYTIISCFPPHNQTTFCIFG